MMMTMKGDPSDTNRIIFTVAVRAMSSSSNLSATTTLAPVVRTQVATGKTIAATVSEYSTLNTLAPPVDTTGCLAPYAISIIDFSDPRSLDSSHG
jgi:hypothetical protein